MMAELQIHDQKCQHGLHALPVKYTKDNSVALMEVDCDICGPYKTPLNLSEYPKRFREDLEKNKIIMPGGD